MDVHSPVHSRVRRRTDDADRVDVRELLHAIVRRKYLVAAAAIGLAALLYIAGGLLPASYSAYAKVMLDPRNVRVMPSENLVSNLDLSDPVVLSEMSVMRSNILLGDLITSLGVERLENHFFGAPNPNASDESRMAALTWAIRKDLGIQREGESYVVVVSFEGSEPKLVSEIVNGVTETYIKLQLADRRESARLATSWIQEQVDEARAEVERAEEAVAAYRAQSLARDGSTYNTANQQLANLTSELAVARSARVAAQAEYDQLKAVLAAQGADGLAKAVTSPLLETLSADRADLVREDAKWARSFAADHPQRTRIADDIANLDAELASEAERVIELYGNKVEVAQLRETSLTQAVADFEDQLAGITENTAGLRQREREADAARQNYEALLARLSAATGQDRLQRPEARIIERAAVPEVPSAPRPKLMGAFGAMLGLTLGVAAALFLELTRSTYRSRRELETETGIRVLATLPRLQNGNMRDIIRSLRRNGNLPFAERIRQLRTFLLMRNDGNKQRVILVASSRPDEGKSVTALALAEMAVLAGKSVVLVDGDLRRSRLVKNFRWEPEHDFSDFILERCDLAEAIHTDEELGLNILAAARPCPEAADELNTDWLRPMMDELKRVYDVVIVDSPPLLKVADGLVLAKVADSIVYVVRWDSTPRAMVDEGLAALSDMRRDVTGFILTQVDPKYEESVYGDAYAEFAK